MNNNDSFETAPNTSTLKTLTLLTFIGSGLAILSGLYNYFTICKSIDKIEQMGDIMGKDTLSTMVHALQVQCDNKLIILLATLICAALCIFGAYMMRNLQKTGYYIYAIGEVALPILLIFLQGAGSMMGMMAIVGLIVPIVFLILYGLQLKNMR
jgi:hypothetical protein